MLTYSSFYNYPLTDKIPEQSLKKGLQRGSPKNHLNSLRVEVLHLDPQRTLVPIYRIWMITQDTFIAIIQVSLQSSENVN